MFVAKKLVSSSKVKGFKATAGIVMAKPKTFKANSMMMVSINNNQQQCYHRQTKINPMKNMVESGSFAKVSKRFASVTVKVPSLGESISDGEIGSWFKKEGDACKEDEVIVAIDTDKVQAEVKAPNDGVITKILVPNQGEKVEIGRELFILEIGAKSSTPAASSTPKAATTTAPSSTPSSSESHSDKREPMIRFRYGKREEIDQSMGRSKSAATETKPVAKPATTPAATTVAPSAPVVTGSTVTYQTLYDLPPRYRRKPISQKEMDSVQYGGEVAIPEVKKPKSK